ncbi:hypothetical protein ACFLWB_02795 [Chloroflexota bacterium]
MTVKGESFTSRYKPTFDISRDEWILEVPSNAVLRKSKDCYEVHLPIYASRTLAIGGNILRNLRREYRGWLLKKQGDVCAVCGKGPERSNPWNLDHQPPLAKVGSKFIDYERVTQNRVIHQHCDSAQNPK